MLFSTLNFGMCPVPQETHNHIPDGDVTPSPMLYTIGHGSRAAAEFLEVLSAAAIGCVVDVRAYPGSRRHPQYVQKELAALLQGAGIGYSWLGKALGGFRRTASDSIHSALAAAAMRAYADHMNSAMFRAGISALLEHARTQPCAMLCAERLPARCHRAMIADYLTVHGIIVIHILSAEQRVTHRRNGAARWTQGRLIYDREGDQQREWRF